MRHPSAMRAALLLVFPCFLLAVLFSQCLSQSFGSDSARGSGSSALRSLKQQLLSMSGTDRADLFRLLQSSPASAPGASSSSPSSSFSSSSSSSSSTSSSSALQPLLSFLSSSSSSSSPSSSSSSSSGFQSFLSSSSGHRGCGDLDACNFDSSAPLEYDKKNCDYDSCIGCTDMLACNYDPNAKIDYLTNCDYIECQGCNRTQACNYNPKATRAEDCEFESCKGCMDPKACNFTPSARLQGSCDYSCDEQDVSQQLEQVAKAGTAQSSNTKSQGGTSHNVLAKAARSVPLTPQQLAVAQALAETHRKAVEELKQKQQQANPSAVSVNDAAAADVREAQLPKYSPETHTKPGDYPDLGEYEEKESRREQSPELQAAAIVTRAEQRERNSPLSPHLPVSSGQPLIVSEAREVDPIDPLVGCTNQLACNFNPRATHDDEDSCDYVSCLEGGKAFYKDPNEMLADKDLQSFQY
eukprot:gb/GEZN01005904.1/.p1 GENE.gb/GEZN01005904.1/~~gb/GEZN01005904.1/.p1  ORF type:complete len:469 (+),score=140.84 gb/GEZN01005904.1/:98-1504(+)